MTAAEAVLSEAFAPAKINLALHVTGQRADGYHELETLVAFADVGDRVTVQAGQGVSLRVRGPCAQGVPTDGTNLVLRAAEMAGVRDAAITLDKHLPSAAGLGGGSSDAAALLRAVGHSLSPAQVLALGADVPMCLVGCAAHVSGIGDVVCPVEDLPALPAVLVNPGVAVSTARVFQALTDRTRPPMTARPDGAGASALVEWLACQRNDLEVAATTLTPVIAEALAALEDAGARLSRMSGSGATCFGLFQNTAAVQDAARTLAAAHPGWWVRATVLS